MIHIVITSPRGHKVDLMAHTQGGGVSYGY